MVNCTSIAKSLKWCQGTPQLPGIRTRLFYISKLLIVAWPTLAKNDEGKVTSSTYNGKFVLADGATWKCIDVLAEKSGVTSDPQGEAPSQTQLNKLTAVHPGVGKEATELCLFVNNDDIVYIIETADGQFRVIGSEMWPTKSTVAQDLGQGPTGNTSTTLTAEASDVVAAPFYDGEIVTEDGTINEGSLSSGNGTSSGGQQSGGGTSNGDDPFHP